MQDALFSMVPLKAQRVDELHVQFYQSQWEVVGSSLVSLVHRVFDEYGLEGFFNKRLLVLIPKVVAPKLITQFRPISLCTVSYKVVSKVIVNRFKPLLSVLIAENQTSFVSGRNIIDNVVVV